MNSLYIRASFIGLLGIVLSISLSAYSRPFKVTFTARLAPKDDELKEYIFQENNPDIPHLIGPAVAP